MATTADDLRPWLGPAWEQLTEAQRDRLAAEADQIQDLYGHPDMQDERMHALNAALRYLLGEATIDDAGEVYRAARRDMAAALATSRQIAKMAARDGMPKLQAATRSGVDRMTLLKDLGER